MGNDGGSIPKRDDLVRTKRSRSKQHDPKAQARLRWSLCALSKEPLREPVVSCPLGQLYNKESLISYLLNPPTATDPGPFGNDGYMVAGHIRSLRDVLTLRLTSNPARRDSTTTTTTGNGGGGDKHQAMMGDDPSATDVPFVCPITMREMNGSSKFVYRKPCGCVMSEAALKQMRCAQDQADDSNATTDQVCPVHGEKDNTSEEWVTINPQGEELDALRAAWDARKQLEKEQKKLAAKDRKRKQAATTNGGDPEQSAAVEPVKKAKKLTTAAPTSTAAPAVKASSAVPLLSATLAAKIAEQKKAHSPAIASLYAKKGGDDNHDADGRSNWMTRGAFTRYA